MERHIFSVTEVNELVKLLLDNEPMLSGICVRGEISNYKMYPSGHHYFSLKDPTGAIRCVMFKGQALRLRFRPENGMKVLVTGRVSVFPRDGAYQLYCDTMTPEGAGDLALAFEQLKEQLYKEGLFDEAHKKPLPRFPERIAIVTSSAGAAVHDMIRILRRRYPLAKVILLPVRVQGAEAPPEIAGAIRYADKWKIGDVIITGRGGGSMEDLWAFNDERVARAIYACETPVPDQVELRRQLSDLAERMTGSQASRLQALRERVDALGRKRVLTDQLAYVQDKRMELLHLQQRLGDLANAEIARKQKTFTALAASLDAMSPLKVLGRGYAVARNEAGQVLKSSGETHIGERIHVTLGSGGLTAVVDHIEEARNGG